MFNYYGSMILKKGCVLYHTSDDNFVYKSKKERPFIFCSFHPSEFIAKNVHFIKLKKDVRLLFMIKLFERNSLISSLENIVNNNNLSKMYVEKLFKIKYKLKKEKFKGWFTSIENGSTVEVALLNNKKLFEYIGTKKYIRNIKRYKNNNKRIRTWGKLFKICDKPIKLNINIRYKSMIEKFRYLEQKSKYISYTTFQLLLKTAKIKYHNNHGKLIKKYNYNKYKYKNENNKPINYSNLKNVKTVKFKN